jgi:preprotein translocase subunit SecD
MERKIRNRSILILIVILVCVFGIIGFPKNIGQLASNLNNRIKLGLDLSGGTYLILHVHVQDAVNAATDVAVRELQDSLTRRNIPASAQKTDPTHILIKGVPTNDWDRVGDLVRSQFPDYMLQPAPGNPNARMLALKTTAQASIENDAYTEARETINRRVNALDISEPDIANYGGQGSYDLVVELPSVTDPARVRDIIKKVGLLQWMLVRGGPYPSQEQALASFNGVLPPDTKLLPQVSSSGDQEWYLVDSVAAITGRDLKPNGAQPSQDQDGRPDVAFTLTRSGGARFAEITQQNVGKYLAIVLDNQVQTAPVIQNRIGENGTIQGGNFTPQSAANLALLLNSGALPASITYLQDQVIGASLGADSIHHGVEACIIGFVAILAFMLIYYKGAGVNADVALILNLIILVAAMAYFQGAFTLPGIAGVILTVGMGVDSNVLVFERIREELRGGKAPPAAVAGGFEHAFKTILDTHITTMAAAAILFTFGTGPVRGFAVTLVVGLGANLFTSIFVSRVIFDYVLGRRERGAALSV